MHVFKMYKEFVLESNKTQLYYRKNAFGIHKKDGSCQPILDFMLSSMYTIPSILLYI